MGVLASRLAGSVSDTLSQCLHLRKRANSLSPLHCAASRHECISSDHEVSGRITTLVTEGALRRQKYPRQSLWKTSNETMWNSDGAVGCYFRRRCVHVLDLHLPGPRGWLSFLESPVVWGWSTCLFPSRPRILWQTSLSGPRYRLSVLLNSGHPRAADRRCRLRGKKTHSSWVRPVQFASWCPCNKEAQRSP